MILLEHSTYDAESIERNLGFSEYSYWFVRKAFRRVLQHFGVIVPVKDPEREVDRIYHSARAHGESCVFISFSPPHQIPTRLACPIVPVFAWEFDTLPNEAWADEPRNDWRVVLSEAPAAIVHCRFSVDVVKASLGRDYAVWSIPAPMADRHVRYAASAVGWRAPFALTIETGLVFDSRRLDLSLFHSSPATRGARAMHLLESIADGLVREPVILHLEGVVYSSVLNPVDGRKNWSDMTGAFIYAFRDQPHATLIIKATHRDLNEGALHILRHLANFGPFQCRVVVIQGLLSQAEYDSFLNATSYTVNTSRGEGQCLPLMEFMSAGRPAVSPRHTAMLDYVSETNSFVVDAFQIPSSWPHDLRLANRCHSYDISFASLFRRYRQSFAVARDDPERYARMSRASTEALLAFCSDEVVIDRFGQVLDAVSLASGFASAPARLAIGA